MRLTSNIKVVLRTDKKKADGTTPIYYSVRVAAYTTRIPTGKSILEKDWDKNTGYPKNNSSLNKMLSTYLQQKIVAWKKFIQQLENDDKPLTINIATSFFDENAKLTFFSFWEQQLTLWKNDKRENTLKSYRSALKMLRSFKPTLNFGDINFDMVEKFDLYMSEVKNNAIGGKFVKHKCLKAMCNQAIKKDLLRKNPYQHFKIKASTAKRNFLSLTELSIITDLEIPQHQIFLQVTKDLYLFSCFTGLRYSDVMNLKFENIVYDPGYITVSLSKTNKAIKVPLSASAMAIIEKYGKHIIKTPQTKVFPQIANQVLNRNIKDLMTDAGINKLMTYHTARHTFASNLVEVNTNILHIRDLLGHARIAETQIYAKSLESDLFSSMSKLQNSYAMNHAVSM